MAVAALVCLAALAITVVLTLRVPSMGTGCAAKPSSCGYPDATTTGVPTGTVLKRVPQDVSSGPGWTYDTRGWISIDGAGATFSGYSVTAPIDVLANNVTVSNVSMFIGGETWAIGLRHAQGVTISNVKIAAPDLSSNRLLVGIRDVYGDVDTLTVSKNDISGTSTGIQVHAGLIEDNYVHDLGFRSGDHTNGFMSNAGSKSLTIRHNTMFNQYGQTDAISLFQDFGTQSNRVVEDNFMAGGGYTIYAGGGSLGAPTNITVRNNKFSTKYFSTSGSYGPVTAWVSNTTNSWSGNVWADGSRAGQAVNP